MKALPLLLLVAAIAAAGWYLNGQRIVAPPHPSEAKTATLDTTPALAPAPAAEVEFPKPSPVAVAAPSPVATGIDGKQKAQLARQVAQSQSQAVAKYPKLAEAGSEINVRFVFRYKSLLAEQSPRLQDPNWPLQLADECVAASGANVRPVATPNQSRVASLSATSASKSAGHR